MMTQMQNPITTLLTPTRHSTRSQALVHSMTDEPPHLPPDEDEPDATQLPELETQVPVLH